MNISDVLNQLYSKSWAARYIKKAEELGLATVEANVESLSIMALYAKKLVNYTKDLITNGLQPLRSSNQASANQNDGNSDTGNALAQRPDSSIRDWSGDELEDGQLRILNVQDQGTDVRDWERFVISSDSLTRTGKGCGNLRTTNCSPVARGLLDDLRQENDILVEQSRNVVEQSRNVVEQSRNVVEQSGVILECANEFKQIAQDAIGALRTTARSLRGGDTKRKVKQDTPRIEPITIDVEAVE